MTEKKTTMTLQELENLWITPTGSKFWYTLHIFQYENQVLLFEILNSEYIPHYTSKDKFKDILNKSNISELTN